MDNNHSQRGDQEPLNNRERPNNNSNNNENNNNDNINGNGGEGSRSERSSEEPFTFTPGTNVVVAINYVLHNDTGTATAENTGGTNAPGSSVPLNSRSGDGASNPEREAEHTLPNDRVGSFYLNFTGLPAHTSPERFSQLMGIAANVALNRLTRNLNAPRKLKKEFFDNLPVKTLKEIGDEVCSICYDPYVEEKLEMSQDKDYLENELISNKRKLDEEEEEHGLSTPNIKKIKTERPHDTTINHETDGREQVQTSQTVQFNENTPEDSTQGLSSSLETSQPNVSNDEERHTESGRNGETNGDEKEEGTEYKHSAVELPCHHMFGKSCIFEWSKEHNSCPICRSAIGTADDLEPLQGPSSIQDLGQDPAFELIRRMLYDTSQNETRNNDEGPVNESSSAETNDQNATQGENITSNLNSTTDTSASNRGAIPGLGRLAAMGARGQTPTIVYLRRNGDGSMASNEDIPQFVRNILRSVHGPSATNTAGVSSETSASPPNPAETPDTNSTETAQTENSTGGRLRSGVRSGISTLLRDLFTRSSMRDSSIPTPERVDQGRADAHAHASGILDAILGQGSGSEPIVGQQGVASYRDASGQVNTVNLPRETSESDGSSTLSASGTTPNEDTTAGLVTALNNIVQSRLNDIMHEIRAEDGNEQNTTTNSDTSNNDNNVTTTVPNNEQGTDSNEQGNENRHETTQEDESSGTT